jgi:hypothetical protein
MEVTRAREGGTSSARRRLTAILLIAVILLLGRLIWLALDRTIESIVAPAVPGEEVSPTFRFVKGGSAEQPDTMVWLTSTALEDCAQVRDGRSRDAKRQIRDLMSSANSSPDDKDEQACAPFQLGKVTAGTRVEILGECGEMAKVKIVSGRLRGQQGCIETDRLDDRGTLSESPPASIREERARGNP